MKAFLAFPEQIARSGLTAAWFVPLGSALVSVFWMWPLAQLLAAYPGRNIIDITRKLFGRVLGTLSGFLLFSLGLALCAPCSHQTAQIMKMAILPRTPIFAIYILGFGVSLYIASLGIEVLGRISLVGVFVLVLSVMILLIFNVSYWSLTAFTPWLGPGVLPLLKTSALHQTTYDELLILGIVAPYLRVRRTIRPASFASLWISALVLTLVVIASQMTLSYPRLIIQTAAFLRVARKIFLGKFIQRLDAMFLTVWLIVSIIRTSLSLYSSTMGLCTALRKQNFRALMPVTVALTLVGAMLIPGLSEAVVLDFDIVRPFSLPVLIVWPWALYIVHRIKSAHTEKGVSA